MLKLYMNLTSQPCASDASVSLRKHIHIHILPPGGPLKQIPPPYDFAGTSPQISLQADLFVSLFSSPPYHFNFIFIFPQQLQSVLWLCFFH